LAAVLERTEARDALVSRDGARLDELPAGAVVGTSSSRRRALLKRARPDLGAAPLRGNVDTRLEKVRRGDVDAAVLSGAGIVRIGRRDAVTQWLDVRDFCPAPGQGVVAMQARAGELPWV